MYRLNCWKLTLASACLLFGFAPKTQAQNSTYPKPGSIDLAVTFVPERTQVAQVNSTFWLRGGAIDAAVTLHKNVSLVASVTGGHADSTASRAAVNKIVYLGGERYTQNIWHRKTPNKSGHLDIFGQWLFGGVHGFDGVYPAIGGAKSTANSFAMQAGGGLNLALTRHIGIRLVDINFLQTYLPNNASETQNDLRLATGLTFRFGKS